MSNLLNEKQKSQLLKIARDTITTYINSNELLEINVSDPLLKQKMGTFITLRKGEKLRGCIGTMVGAKPLYLAVRDMTISSATQDPRFGPLIIEELNSVTIEISVLSPLKKISNSQEIVLGYHGVLVKDEYRSGVYLPQVAKETGWSKEQFMDSLCQDKAGIDANCWRMGQCDIYIFTAEVFSE